MLTLRRWDDFHGIGVDDRLVGGALFFSPFSFLDLVLSLSGDEFAHGGRISEHSHIECLLDFF